MYSRFGGHNGGVVKRRRGSVRLLKNLILLANQGDSPGQPKKVFACSHNRSLQLLCTVGGSQARLDARTEFKISLRSPNECNPLRKILFRFGTRVVCSLFSCPPWLAGRIALVGQENQILQKTYASSSPLNYASVMAAKTRIQCCLCNCL